MSLANKAKELDAKLKRVDEEIANLLEREQELLSERQETESRKAMLSEYEALKARKAELEEKLQFAKENDPTEMQRLQKEIEAARKSANLWTDNTWACQDWLKKKVGASKQDCMRQLGMTEDFDYPVYQPPPKRKN